MNFILQGVWLRVTALILLTLIVIMTSMSVSFGSDFSTDLTADPISDSAMEPMQPEFFVGNYTPVEFIESGVRSGPSEIEIQGLTIVVDKLSNTLKAYSNTGQIFLVPFYNINLEARITTDRYPAFCLEAQHQSTSHRDAIETRIITRKKWGCALTIKKTQDYFRIGKTPIEGEVLFTFKRGPYNLSTYRFKKVQ
jgi:hypothetical protein